MKIKILLAVCTLAFAGAALSYAGQFDHRVDITIDKPFVVPGVHVKGTDVLPAGSYIFRTIGTFGERNLVQILNKDENTVYATILTLPNTRFDIPDRMIITVHETPVGAPAELNTMYYPGDKDGEQFVYPPAK